MKSKGININRACKPPQYYASEAEHKSELIKELIDLMCVMTPKELKLFETIVIRTHVNNAPSNGH